MHKKGRILLVFAVAFFLFILSLFTLNKHVLNVNIDNFLQKLMTYDLGFSDQRNLYDDGELGDYDNWSHLDKLLSATKTLVVSTPDIISRKIFGSNSEIVSERLDIDINFKNYQQLLNDRKRAIDYGINKDPVTVNGKVTYKGEDFKAELRLKGDLIDHWNSKYRMSLRVNIKGQSTVMGFSKFSLQKPLTRAHPYDQTFQSLMRRAGNLSTAHNYLHIYVNGVDWGIMNVEEHVSPELLEKQEVKDSIIVRFGNDDRMFYKLNTKNRNNHYKISDPTLIIKLYDSNKSLKDAQRRKWLSYITQQNTMKNPNIFDVDHLSRTLFMATVWGNFHVLGQGGSKYYFNPYTLELEPITSDANYYYRLDKNENIKGWGLSWDRLHYIYSDLIKKKEFKDNLKLNFDVVKEAVLNIKNDLYYYDNFFPFNMKKSGETVLNNLDYVEKNLDHYLVLGSRDDGYTSGAKLSVETGQEKDFLDHVHARHYINGEIEIHNLLPDSVMINGLLVDGKSFDLEPVEIIGYNSAGYIPRLIATELKGIKDSKIQIVTEFRGDTRTTEIGPTLVRDGLHNPLINSMNKYNYIIKSGDDYEIVPGNHIVDDGIVIHGNLYIKPNTSLNFTKNAYLIVKGSLFADGGNNRSIKFLPVGDTWSGMYVLGNGGESLLSGVEISKARELDDGILKLSSGVTFYKSTVKISNVLIKDSTAEDALNLVHSEFAIDKLAIENSYSDALDIDFSNGLISSSSFHKVGGDALDFSGSDVSVSNVKISMVKDKAFSVGEKSKVDIVNSAISDIGVGIASKDGSVVKGVNIVISDYKLKSAMSYIKKDFYGSPEIELNDCQVSGNNSPFLREKGTRMIVDGIDVEEEVIDVKKLYRGEIMKK